MFTWYLHQLIYIDHIKGTCFAKIKCKPTINSKTQYTCTVNITTAKN